MRHRNSRRKKNKWNDKRCMCTILSFRVFEGRRQATVSYMTENCSEGKTGIGKLNEEMFFFH